MNVIFTGIDFDEVDAAFVNPGTSHLYLYGNDTLHVYERDPNGGPKSFVKAEQDLSNHTHVLKNTDAAFLYQPEPDEAGSLMLLKGYDMYDTDISNNMIHLGKVTAPCLEKDLEENELPQTFIISQP